ncbi:ABC transporter ATP-binding protein [Candidatus Methanodesulfokora washburnensis]|uniref:ABC transporter ATP-binding protein n=1 Tax=Candidatus Methanodesulfokora washburnensis TaxID=2478471 RepID=A0A429GHZ6_9CREN|nr:ATP-binding cassette domain-containing protein [Candidatus Methanodesulfokores washburnensis]RSN73395.1 ABC transporter ATP-binding protein [Candidatus Methanodesulfokores washburnensis]
MEGDETILEVINITKKFGGLTALNNVSFDVRKGEILAVIGPNGAGKTTLVNIISGILRPTAGRVVYKGIDITNTRPNKRAKMGIARTFQVPIYIKNLRAIDSVAIPLTWKLKDLDLARKKAADLLERVGFDNPYKMGKDLTLTEEKRLEIARALALEPELLLLDEPAAGLRPNEIDELESLILSIAKQRNITIILIEHIIKFVMKICHRVIVLNFGNKIAEGSPEDVVANPDVITAYLGGII